RARPGGWAGRRSAEGAGIRTGMMPGDHRHRAAAVARELGMMEPGAQVATGARMDRWSDDELADRLQRISVFARVSPRHKLRIVRALRDSEIGRASCRERVRAAIHATEVEP